MKPSASLLFKAHCFGELVALMAREKTPGLSRRKRQEALRSTYRISVVLGLMSEIEREREEAARS